LGQATISELDASKTLDDDAEAATLKISRQKEICSLKISVGSVFDDFKYDDGLSGLICWSNELCDLSNSDVGNKIIEAGGDLFEEELASLEIQATTDWGPVKCPTGEAVIVGPLTFTNIPARFIFLAVGPLSPTNDDADWDVDQDENALHVLDTELRAAYRSSFQKIAMTGVEAIGISPITSRVDGAMYERTLWVGLKTVIEEAKRTQLRIINLYASSGKEANLLIKMAMDLGLQC